ncbi:hypothetical protein V8B97DRAFT_1935859 [Scleroderma yunnanense]
MFHLHRKRESDAEAEQRDSLRAQRELLAFGTLSVNTDDEKLTESESWWSQRFEWLKNNGYLLRPRYAPNWVPSWHGTKMDMFSCEDSSIPKAATRILDGTRISDGVFVVFKIVKRSEYPYEVDIARFFSTDPIRSDPANHCVPIYDVLPLPGDADTVLIVMPLLREYKAPPFCTVGEAVDCFRQLFAGLQFMHKHRVAHRDCMSMNIMMDASRLYVDAFHPVHPLMRRDFSRFARYKTRTQRPVRYLFIDFGLSRQYDSSIIKPLEYPIWGGDKEVPEFHRSDEPCDPFPTDVFYIGNAIRKDFIQPKHGFEFMEPLIADMINEDPSKRPTMNEVVARFEAIQKTLDSWKLRSRVVDRYETLLEVTTRTALHWTRQLTYVVRRLPAVPPQLS